MTHSVPGALLASMRPGQWTKNLFVFAGVVFSQSLGEGFLLLRAAGAFAIFCLLSGSGYLINDLRDMREDRAHPRKRTRPLASGRLTPRQAWTTAAVTASVAVGVSFSLGAAFGWIALSYFLLTVAYSLVLKHLVILDVMAVALGFVLRAAAGGAVIGVNVSSWLIICTVLLALFLVLGKRRHELLSLGETAGQHRSVLSEYSPGLLDQMMSVVTASTVVTYALYTMSPRTVAEFGTSGLKYTIPFVLYGIFRYLYLVHRKRDGGRPEMILITDRPLLASVTLWLAAVIVIVYLLPGH